MAYPFCVSAETIAQRYPDLGRYLDEMELCEDPQELAELLEHVREGCHYTGPRLFNPANLPSASGIRQLVARLAEYVDASELARQMEQHKSMEEMSRLFELQESLISEGDCLDSDLDCPLSDDRCNSDRQLALVDGDFDSNRDPRLLEDGIDDDQDDRLDVCDHVHSGQDDDGRSEAWKWWAPDPFYDPEEQYHKENRHARLEDLPCFQPFSRQPGRVLSRKDHKPCIDPRTVKRFLISRSGRGLHWSDVYEELCTWTSRRTLGRHEVDARYIDLFVSRTVKLENGVPTDVVQQPGGRVSVAWVHPETGILMRYKDEPKKPPLPRGWGYADHERMYERLDMGKDSDSKLVKMNGIWFVVDFSAIPDEMNNPAAVLPSLGRSRKRFGKLLPKETPSSNQPARTVPCAYDIVLNRAAMLGPMRKSPRTREASISTPGVCEQEWGARIYAFRMRPANKREIRRFAKSRA